MNSTQNQITTFYSALARLDGEGGQPAKSTNIDANEDWQPKKYLAIMLNIGSSGLKIEKSLTFLEIAEGRHPLLVYRYDFLPGLYPRLEKHRAVCHIIADVCTVRQGKPFVAQRMIDDVLDFRQGHVGPIVTSQDQQGRLHMRSAA
jgi:hypothetical protein